MSFVYLTYLEPISGVYEGQVIDVCAHLGRAHGVAVKLIAILSARDFEKQRNKLLVRESDAIAIRSWFGWRAWPLAHRVLHAQIARALPPHTKAVIARGPVAARIALDLKKRGRISRVGYDGRGAASAEWSEYSAAPSDTWRARMPEIERQAVLESDMRIAVSSALVQYWRDVFGYAENWHVVIPCTLSAHYMSLTPNQDEIACRRATLGIAPDQTVICYAGSQAEWQSIAKLDLWLYTMLESDPMLVLLMMTRADLSKTRTVQNYPGRVHQIWVNPDRVRETMEVADFGLLVREQSMTNRVAAPVKFAEYLAAGLKILISPEIGDYSKMVEDHDLGLVCDLASAPPALTSSKSQKDRIRLTKFANRHLIKAAYYNSYAKLLVALEVLYTRHSDTPSQDSEF